MIINDKSYEIKILIQAYIYFEKILHYLLYFHF